MKINQLNHSSFVSALGVHGPLLPSLSTPDSNRDSFPTCSTEHDDFAAYQRELSRALVDAEVTSPDVVRNV